MPGGLQSITQDSFASGMFQAPDTQRIPATGAYDVTNGLIDADQGVVYRRGGATAKTAALTENTTGTVWDGYFPSGRRTLVLASKPYVLNPSTDASLVQVGDSTYATPVGSRPAMVGSILAIPTDPTLSPVPGAWNGGVMLYGGAVANHSVYSTGTITVTNGSAAVTATGSSWTTNIGAGDLLYEYGGGFGVGQDFFGTVASVDSNTTLTLSEPWAGPTRSTTSYQVQSVTGPAAWTRLTPAVPIVLGSAANRLLIGYGDTVFFSEINRPWDFNPTDYHKLPGGANVVGIDSTRTTGLIFTTGGIYAIGNIALDLTDDAGNPLQTLSLISKEIVCWDQMGLANWQNATVVPALDSVYLTDGVSSPVDIGKPVRGLYQRYVAAGNSLGKAAVFNGHYVLPVWTGRSRPGGPPGTWVDTLVCNLQTGAWTRMAGYSAKCSSFTQRVATTNNQPALIGYQNTPRIVDLTSWWAPTATVKNEPDGSTHSFSLTTRDFSTANVRALFKKMRVWVEGVDAAADVPTLTAGVAEGLPGTSFTTLTGTAGASTGDTPAGVFTANTGGRRVRFQIVSTAPWASLKIKAIDVFVRQKGRA